MLPRKILLTALAVLTGLLPGGVPMAQAQTQSTVELVYAHDSDFYTQWLPAGQVVMITVSGDGDSDLDLFVRTPGGRLIASDTDATDECLVIFVAPTSGAFEIEVENLGPRSNLYELKMIR